MTGSAATVLPLVEARRYVAPLREGGSLPAVVEVEDGAFFVVKFRGAGQGARALLAELLVGLLAREAALPVPDLALVRIDGFFGRSERDPEIQDLLRASEGINVGLRYLEGALNYDEEAAGDLVTAEFASRLVWFDAFITNPDRTARNPNLLIHEARPYLIDHGSALYAHHAWSRFDPSGGAPAFLPIRDHLLLPRAEALHDADEAMVALLTPEAIRRAVDGLPEALLDDALIRGEFSSIEAHRDRYESYLLSRLRAPRAFVRGAEAAREELLRTPPLPFRSRR